MGKGNPAMSANRKLDNAMKSKGLQKLRWYCQVCEKQMRDENGFKCHTQTENHLRRMLVVGESAGKHISDYSSRFQSEFVGLLSRRWGTKRVRVNLAYQEYISDKTHLHMNATRWLSLTEFAKHLGRTGVAHVDETEKGWFIAWIDNSPKALARARGDEARQKELVGDEERERKLIQEQIERARKDGEKRRIEAAGGVVEGTGHEGEASTPVEDEPTRELVRAEGEKVSLNLSFAGKPAMADTDSPVPSTSSAPASTSISKPITFGAGPSSTTNTTSVFKANPLKKPNPLKASSNPLKSSSASSSSSTSGTKRPAAPLSAVEALMAEDLKRKERMNGGTGGGEQNKMRYF